MRKVFLFVAVISLIGSTAAFAQNGPWKVKGDNGETVQVLPTPAAAQAQENHGLGQQIPTAMNGYSVFSASYGAIPGQMDDHGGSVASDAAFLPIFYNGATAASLQSGIDAFVNNFSGSDPGMTVITQYSKTGNAITAALVHVPDFVDNLVAPRRISDSGVQSYLSGLFNAAKVPVAT